MLGGERGSQETGSDGPLCEQPRPPVRFVLGAILESAAAAVTSAWERGVGLCRRLKGERVEADGDGGVGSERGGRAEGEGRRRAEEGQLDEGFEGEEEDRVAEGD
eukprot:7064368-Prymnesium_polylepis.1